MNKKIFVFITAILLIICHSILSAQSINVYSVNTSKYPEIKGEVVIKDAAGKNVRLTNTDDVNIIDGGINRIVKKIYCEPNVSKFSAILTFDRSASMMRDLEGGFTIPSRMTIAKNAAKAWVKALDTSRSEATITCFSTDAAWIFKKFINSKTMLIDSINAHPFLNPVGGTDYNSGFLRDRFGNPGCLEVARFAKYKPIVIYLTDGEHDLNYGPIKTNEILNLAKQLDVTVFVLTLGLPVPEVLKQISTSTGGAYYENPASEEEARNIYLDILEKSKNIGSPAPCDVYWDTDCNGGNLRAIAPKFGGVFYDTTYFIPNDIKPFLEVTPRDYEFFNVAQGNNDIQVTITARNNTVNFSTPGFTSSDSKFSIIDWGGTPPPFSLKKDDKRTIKLRFTAPPDTAYFVSNFQFITDACGGSYINPSAGWVYLNDVDMGIGTINQPKTKQATLVFCNKSGKDITIKEFRLKGGDLSSFGIENPPKDVFVPKGTCIDLTFRFNPPTVGQKVSTIEAEDTEGKIYKSNIKGNGSGNAEISAIQSLTYENVDCKTPSRETVIEISNPGALPLNISSFVIDGTNPSDFAFVPANPGTMTISPGDKQPITVRFQPASAGNKSANITISSDAGNSPTFVINLSGTRDSIGFNILPLRIDFGQICPGIEYETTLNILTNTGSVNLDVTANIAAPFTLPTNSWTVAPGNGLNVTIKVMSNTEGRFTQKINFTDNCGVSKSIDVVADVYGPKIQAAALNMTAVQGAFTEDKIIIRNPSQVELTITSATPSDAQFTIVSPPLNWVIPAGGQIEVTVRYSPVSSQNTNATIDLKGNPCSFSDKLIINGNPLVATADITTDKLEGFVGETVSFPVRLQNMVRVKESGTNTINTKLSFDATMLTFKGTTPSGINAVPGSGFVQLNALPLNNMNGDVLVTVNFEATTSLNTVTPMTFSDTKSNEGVVSFRELPGEFKLKPASATLSIGEIKGEPGQIIEIPIKLPKSQNLTSFNGSISTTIEFNASLLEPVSPTPTGTVKDKLRTIELTDLPLVPTGDLVLKIYKFKVMLGDEESTQIKIFNSSVKTGKVLFEEINGTFTLLNVCKSGGTRLFNPYGQDKLISILPNPAEGSAKISFELVESGATQLYITNVLGKTETYLINGILDTGVHELIFDATKFTPGLYFVTLVTKSSVLTEYINIVK